MKNLIIFISIFIFSLTTNAQNGWVSQNSGTFENLNGVYFLDVNTGWVVGNNGVVLKTINGGQNWSQIVTGSNTDNFSVHFPSASTGYVGTTNDNIVKTTNGGSSWNMQHVNGPYFQNIISIYFVDNSIGFASESYPGYLRARTTNGGQNWTVYTDGRTGIYTCGTGSYIWILTKVNNQFGINRSNDGGSTWNFYSSNLIQTSNNLNSIHFITSTQGFIAGDAGTIYKSMDSGENWVALNSNSSSNLKSVISPNLNNTWAVGSNGTILTTSNSGNTWFTQNSNTTNTLNSVYFLFNTYTGWACGNGGSILKTTNGGVGIKTISSVVPNEYKLSQNFPNPFNPNTTIRFDVPRSSFVKIIVYDIEGKIVQELVNHDLTPGSYEVSFYAVNLSSGVYYYKMNTENYNSTRKMILIK